MKNKKGISFHFFIIIFFTTQLNAQNFRLVKNSDVFNDEADSHGVVWHDYNNDGWVDLYISNLDGPDFLYKNNKGQLIRIKPHALNSDSTASASAIWLDYDKDGDADLLVSKGSTKGGIPNILYRYDGDDNFIRLSKGEVGELSDYKGYTESSSASDINLDGYPDIIEVNWRAQPNIIYINQRDGTFKKVDYPGLTDVLDFGITANWVDIDKNGLTDLFIARQGYRAAPNDKYIFELSDKNRVYIKSSDSTFQQRPYAIGKVINPEVNDGGNSITSSFGDFNNDGWLDLFVGNFDGEINFLYENDKAGKFISREDTPISREGGFTIGSSWGDFNNDGFLDLLAINGYGSPEKNLLYINEGGNFFSQVNNEELVTREGRHVATALADYDNDGDLDILIVGREGHPNLLYENIVGDKNNWLKIKPEGKDITSLALNTKAEIWYVENEVKKFQYRELHQQTGYGGHNELLFHFGLGKTTRVDSVRIHWASNKKQTFSKFEINKTYCLQENDSPKLCH